ncbi:MAG TPA: hypothetical protein VN326_06920 [Casimicrobiaceae bacterium]|jgi:hypothetical protein|nr:hypothetical protein [Casimicrobiaceae bacterium]
MTTFERSSKQRSIGTPRWRLPLFAAAVLVVTGGSAYAGIPGDNTINGCYNKVGGGLRVIDATVTQCKSNETPISWNEVGPEGPVGPIGPQGPQGAMGAAGASDAYVAKSRGASGLLDGHVDIVALTVPAGDYVISAKTRLLNGDTVGQIVECRLSTGDFSTGNVIAGGDVTIPLQDTASFAATSTLTLRCFGTATNLYAANWVLTAIGVGVLH